MFAVCFISTADRKVFSKLNFHVPGETVRRIVLSTSGVIEPILCSLRERIDKKLEHTTENILVCTVCLCASSKPVFACLNTYDKIQ